MTHNSTRDKAEEEKTKTRARVIDCSITQMINQHIVRDRFSIDFQNQSLHWTKAVSFVLSNFFFKLTSHLLHLVHKTDLLLPHDNFPST